MIYDMKVNKRNLQKRALGRKIPASCCMSTKRFVPTSNVCDIKLDVKHGIKYLLIAKGIILCSTLLCIIDLTFLGTLYIA